MRKNMIRLLLVVILGIAAILMLNPKYVGAKSISVPDNLGNIHTFTYWDKINWSGDCKQLINYGNKNNYISNVNGIITYGDFFAGALTSTFGQVGDMLLIIQNDNSVYPVIMADTKNQSDNNCSKWGHQNGQCIVEFHILYSDRKSLYGKSGGYISEAINKPIKKVINLGSVYSDDAKYLINAKRVCLDNGLENYTLLTSPYETVKIERNKPKISYHVNMYRQNKKPIYHKNTFLMIG